MKNFIDKIGIILCILLFTLVGIILILTIKKGFSQPYLICDPPSIVNSVTQYYIKCCANDPNIYNINPNDRYYIYTAIDPNKTIIIKDGFTDPNFYSKAIIDGSLKLNLHDVSSDINYSLLVRACDDNVCSEPSFVSFIPVNIPHKIKGLEIDRSDVNINKYFYIVFE